MNFALAGFNTTHILVKALTRTRHTDRRKLSQTHANCCKTFADLEMHFAAGTLGDQSTNKTYSIAAAAAVANVLLVLMLETVSDL